MYTIGGLPVSTLKRTQMYIPEELLDELKRKAGRENTTISNIVRTAVLDLIKKDRAKNWETDPLWEMVGMSQSEDHDLSVNHDKYLYGKDQ